MYILKHRPNSHQADDHMRIQKSHLHDTVLQLQKHPQHTRAEFFKAGLR